MTAYSYDTETGFYIGKYFCQIDPVRTKREGYAIYLLPANATFTEPPDFDEQTENIVWDETSMKWHVENKPIESLGNAESDAVEPVEDPELWFSAILDEI